MTPAKAILGVMICMVIGAAIGGSIGFLIGRFSPDALRVQFRAANDPGIDPVQIGLGIGLPQGCMLGAAVGVALVAILSWHDVRTRERSRPSTRSDD